MLGGTRTILITCGRGLVDHLQAEVESLGYDVESAQRTSVVVRGTFADAMTLNLRLRTAFTVLWLLEEFRANSPDELYDRVVRMPWEELVPVDETLTVTSRVDTPSINNSMFPSLKVKDAIVDRINRKRGRRPDSGPEKDGVVVALYWRAEHCRIYLDTSGRKLADRSYRRMPHTAPMQETLAAAVLLAAGYDGTGPLVNPMCGSGTLAIEAALIGAGRSPGLLRGNFSLMHVHGFDKDAWRTMRRELQRDAKKRRPSRIIATDNDPKAIEAARKNAMTAGVEHLVEFDVCDFAETELPERDDAPGLVILNPEYGRRLGAETQLAETYARIGDFFKGRCAGWTGAIFTGNLELAKCVGLKARRRVPFRSADIDCRLLLYDLYAGTRRRPAEDTGDRSSNPSETPPPSSAQGPR